MADSTKDTGVLSRELNAAFELREAAKRRARLERFANRYLDEHCDGYGWRLEGGMAVEEFAHEAGLNPTILRKAVTKARRTVAGRRLGESFPEACRAMFNNKQR